jgi:hypothetical protein
MRRLFVAAVALLLATTSSCVIVDPSCVQSGASVIVAPGVVIVSVGESVTPSATQSWCGGRRQEPAHPRWSLAQPSDTAYVFLDAASGRITGRRVGHATVVAITDQVDQLPAVSVTVK